MPDYRLIYTALAEHHVIVPYKPLKQHTCKNRNYPTNITAGLQALLVASVCSVISTH